MQDPIDRNIPAVLFVFCVVVMMSVAIVQSPAQFESRRGGTSGDDAARLERAGLEIGTPYPDITVYDAAGNPLKLHTLKGQYTVIVLGCLT